MQIWATAVILWAEEGVAYVRDVQDMRITHCGLISKVP
jgi:hypothetical protein